MKPITIATFLLAGLSHFPIPAFAQANLGQTSFKNSGAESAQEPFLKGILLLHSFEYEDAREAFQEAQHRDPDFAMAYWGEAMTHNHPIWQQKYKEPARKVLAKLGATRQEQLNKAPTEREKSYLEAVAILFDEGPKLETDKAYAAMMEEIYKNYPDDLDAAAFYALALLGTSHGDRDFSIYMKAAAVAEVVFRTNPKHPGAAHYLIHAYDDPVHAPLGLRPATSYAEIAPSAAHALHMPSHIFVALGMWDESASTNAASYKASVERAKRKGIAVENHHALSWLIYDQLQLGMYAVARTTLKQMHADMEAKPTPYTRYHYALMQAYQVLETDEFDDALPVLTVTASDNNSTKAVSNFIAGLQALNLGDLDQAHLFAERLEKVSALPKSDAWTKTAEVLRLELQAFIKQKEGNMDEAISTLKQATALEDAMDFVFGPPRVIKPSYEALGEIYLQNGFGAEAITSFKTALEQRPGRSRSLKGLIEAGIKTGQTDVVNKALSQLKINWKTADENVLNRIEMFDSTGSPE